MDPAELKAFETLKTKLITAPVFTHTGRLRNRSALRQTRRITQLALPWSNKTKTAYGIRAHTCREG